MQPQIYKLTFLPIFRDDLEEAVQYIQCTLQNPEAALKFSNAVKLAIRERHVAPLAFAPYQTRKPHNQTYYRINIKNFSIFYVVIGDTMEVRRLIYSRRDIDKIL